MFGYGHETNFSVGTALAECKTAANANHCKLRAKQVPIHKLPETKVASLDTNKIRGTSWISTSLVLFSSSCVLERESSSPGIITW